MKKVILSIIAAALVVGIAVALFIHNSHSEDKQTLKPIEDPVFVYANLKQLADKGAFDRFITEENRRCLATMLSSSLDSDTNAEHLKNIITNIDNIGIDTQVPIYGYINENMTDFVIMAFVADVAKMDRSIALLSYLLEQNGETVATTTTEDDVRILECEDILIAYNATTLAVTCGKSEEALSIALDALSRPQVDMSVFEERDMAVLINAHKCIQIASVNIDKMIVELSDMYNAGEIDEEMFCAQAEAFAENQAIIDGYAPYFAPNSTIMLSATFDLGRMTLAYNSQGVNFGEYAGVIKPTNPAHLSHLSKDSFMVMSAGVDGELLTQLIRSVIDNGALESAGITPTNEINMIISIACDAISTINGSTTLALENIEGEIKQRYNNYWDEYSIEPSIDSVNAILMMDVVDSYIISNIAQFAGGFLNRKDATHYSLSLMGYNFSMGQDDGLFHVGVNKTPDTQTPSAQDAYWAKDIEGALSYIVINADALMSSQFMKSTNEYITSQLLEEYRELYVNATDIVSYIYASAQSLDAAEIVVVFDNKDVNSLEQINALALPVLIKQCQSAIL